MLWLIGNIICWTLLRWIMWWHRLAEILKCLYKQVIWAVKGTLHDHFEVKWKLMPEILNNVQYWTLLQNWWIELIKTLSLFWNCTNLRLTRGPNSSSDVCFTFDLTNTPGKHVSVSSHSETEDHHNLFISRGCGWSNFTKLDTLSREGWWSLWGIFKVGFIRLNQTCAMLSFFTQFNRIQYQDL